MLMDEEPVPAAYALVRPQERPVFKCDDKGREFASGEDLDERQCEDGPHKPRLLEEPKPPKGS